MKGFTGGDTKQAMFAKTYRVHAKAHLFLSVWLAIGIVRSMAYSDSWLTRERVTCFCFR